MDGFWLALWSWGLAGVLFGFFVEALCAVSPKALKWFSSHGVLGSILFLLCIGPILWAAFSLICWVRYVADRRKG